jgi:hypothetical protein
MIGGLSTATGVKIETIRYYERAGLISPPLRTGDGVDAPRRHRCAKVEVLNTT